ncbi:hypothetical protein Pve01_91180 [Planomonospora venezuelensis]|nr:hypothetical protein Pve01_91180 [Planomonospora venezuelensis]
MTTITNDQDTAQKHADGPTDPQTAPDAPTGQDGPQNGRDDATPTPDTFPAAVVKELRDENAKLRIKGKRSEDLTTRLVHAMAGQTGRLADPTDLPVTDDLMDDDGMPDSEKIGEAIHDLLKSKPHLSSTRPKVTDIGQGPRPGTQDVSLADILRAGA